MTKINRHLKKIKPITPKSLKAGKVVKRKKTWYSKLVALIKGSIIFFFLSTACSAFLYRYVNPVVTPLMLLRTSQQVLRGDKIFFNYKWMNLDLMSPYVIKTSLAAEDKIFYLHNGFDFKTVDFAVTPIQINKNTKGGNTISQQTAKNVFLWPSGSWISKGLKIYFTFLIEFTWSKNRILEVYLNVIETGNGVYGSEAAAKKYFFKSCINLTKKEAAAIASIYPLPLELNPLKPTLSLKKKQQWIFEHADSVIISASKE